MADIKAFPGNGFSPNIVRAYKEMAEAMDEILGKASEAGVPDALLFYYMDTVKFDVMMMGYVSDEG